MKKFLLMSFLTSLLVFGDDAPGTALSGKGKFVFGQVSSFARGQYMLNTETGELWNIQRDDNNISVLERIFFSCIDKDYKSQYCFSPVSSKEEDLKIKFGKK